MTFGVEHHGVTIPILKQGKVPGVALPALSSSVNAPAQTAPSTR